MNSSTAISVNEASQVGKVRRTLATLSSRLGFDDTESGRLAVMVTELANNLVLHATEGEILLRPLGTDDRVGLEVLALDRGPGMPDIARCMRDGYSTAGTLGNGLGAVMRMADAFDIHSVPGIGTAVMVQMWSRSGHSLARPPDGSEMDIGAVCVPKAGEEACGDAFTFHLATERSIFLVADGLGHGPSASTASLAAMRVMQARPSQEPAELLEEAHKVLRGTRGAAVAVAALMFADGIVQFAGIGNVAATILKADGSSKSMVSHNGIVGHQVRKFQEFTYPWPASGILLMHSDGLGSHWRLDQYPGILTHHPSLVAGVLYRDYHRGRDDVTVLVARSHIQSQWQTPMEMRREALL